MSFLSPHVATFTPLVPPLMATSTPLLPTLHSLGLGLGFCRSEHHGRHN
jgi:hypothetical protein